VKLWSLKQELRHVINDYGSENGPQIREPRGPCSSLIDITYLAMAATTMGDADVARIVGWQQNRRVASSF
jgi:hypothetical protein